MKIIVNNADEQKLIQRFIDALNEMWLDNMEREDHKWAHEHNEEPNLSSEEYMFIDGGLYEAKVEIESKEKPLIVYDDDIITGECYICGAHTVGTIDGCSIDYAEYLWLTSEESCKSWKCETCWGKDHLWKEAEE
ncbi:hypothetical protein [Paenibacillus larvae]|uniref:hypothetical protein n=1 Tax=Paenibacillus larvae TaxID=1464 RepID=UPI0001693C16|nr:hypothetical protein [Paenibacillus larvae]MCY9512505.1 hypothetical protein [Paenibacillus larvae]MCY9527165.1 hypothetical protein [Paenibacillus larvae]MDT2258306.1 hypothetical protein [Paenibacillus larvae]